MSLSYSSKSMQKVLSLIRKLLKLALQSLNDVYDDRQEQISQTSRTKTTKIVRNTKKKQHTLKNTFKMKKKPNLFKCFSFTKCCCFCSRCFDELDKKCLCSKCVAFDVSCNNIKNKSSSSSGSGESLSSFKRLFLYFKPTDRHIANFCLVIFISTIFCLYLHPIEA
jgi:hypothetical protein